MFGELNLGAGESEADRVTATVGIVDWRLQNYASTWLCTLTQSKGPFIPYFSVRIVAPYLDLDYLTLACDDRLTDGEVKWEPALHARSVLTRIDAIEDVLVKLSGEVTCKAMNLSLSLLDWERKAAILTH